MASATKTKKNTKPAETKPEKKEKVPRVPFMNTDLGTRNDDGKLVGQPEGFDGKLHLKPSRDDFADHAEFYDFQAAQCEGRVEYFGRQRDKWLEQAASFRRFGDPEKRKKFARAERLREQLAALDAELEDEGTEVVES